MSRTKIQLSSKKIRLAQVKMDRSHASKKAYEKRLKHLQLEMLRVQQAYFHQKQRAILVFEGWDAAGKGGAIRRLTEKLDPRGFSVYPIGAPKPDEQGRHYLYRFWERIPAPGRIAIFDRSWYGRVLVEKVEGFADAKAVARAYAEINEFERMLLDDGVRALKFFIHITPDEQLRRFEERLSNPYKHWKLTEEDLRNRHRWNDYLKATELMFDRTSTRAAPWNVIGANRKWHSRTTTLEIAIEELSKGVDLSTPTLSPSIIAAAESALGIKPDATMAGATAKAKGSKATVKDKPPKSKDKPPKSKGKSKEKGGRKSGHKRKKEKKKGKG